jgi:FkbM family methyltransferase
MNNETGKVYSFEIQPKIYNLLLKNIKDNNLDSIITPIFNGLGNTQSIIDLIIPKDYDLNENPGNISLLNNNYNETDDKISTSIITFDSLNFNNISVMKIDVEGYEIQVLEGAINTINKNKPYIILEIWHINKEKYFEWFKNNLPNYDIELIDGWDYLLKPKN